MRSLFRLFDRKPAPAPPPPVEAGPSGVVLHASARAETFPTGGLIVVELAVRADAPGPGTLRVYVGGAEQPSLEKAVAVTVEPLALWVAVHGHLLPDGPAPIRVELAGAVAELTLQVKNAGPLADATRGSLERSGAPLASDRLDSSFYDYADDGLAAWFDRSPAAIEAHLAGLFNAGAATAGEIAALTHFAEHGYLILPDAVAAEALADLNAAMDDAVAKKVEGYEWGASQRLHNLHNDYPAIAALWRHPTILRMLELIFGARPIPYQSLTYVFGSEQLHHQDTVVLTPFPAGRMCGVWTALEDIQPESGELMVYPGSHRLPRTYMKDLGIAKVGEDWTAFGDAVDPVWKAMLKDSPAPELYRPKAGTVLIWHENLMHAGRVRRNRDQSRRSIVGHYFAEGCVAYHDANGMPAALKG